MESRTAGINTTPSHDGGQALLSLLGRPLTILIADDNPVVQKIMSNHIAKLRDIEATVVSNGKDALQEAERTTFDLIFVDKWMPVMVSGPRS